MATPALRIRIAPKFPTKQQAGVGLAVSRTGGVVTYQQDWNNVQNGITPPDDVEVLARDPSDGQFYRTTPDGLADLIRPVASQLEAETGSNNTKTMTPLRATQHFADRVPFDRYVAAGAGTSDFQAAADDGGVVTVNSGSYSIGAVTPGANPTFWRMGETDNGSSVPLDLGTDLTEQFFGGRLLYKKSHTFADDQTLIEFQRVVDHSDGSTGHVVPNVSVTTIIEEDCKDYQWPLLSRVWNRGSADANHTAIYGQAWREDSSAALNFAGVFEQRDKTGLPNPSVGAAAVEIDVFANGTDSGNRRVGLNIVVGKGVSGASAEAGIGIWLTPAHGDATEGRFKRAVAVDADCDVAFDAALATFLSGGPAFRMAIDQYLSFTANNDRTIGYTSSGLQYKVSNATKFQVSDSGAVDIYNVFNINGDRVLTARRTGWTAPTGTRSRAAFDVATVTTAQLAAAVAALYDDLGPVTGHGLIGA